MDTLKIFGDIYSNVTGIVATDNSDTEQTYIRPQGSLSITTNGTGIDIASYATVDVAVPTGGSGTDTSDATLNSAGQLLSGVTAYAKGTKYTGTIPTKSQADLTVAASTVTTPAGYYTESASKSIDTATLNSPLTLSRTPRLTVDSETGLITASIPNSETSSLIVKTAGYISKDDRLAIKVSGSNTSQLTVQSATTVTPTESSQTAVAKGVYTTGDITVGAIPSTHVGSGVARISSANVTVSGATVTAPIGYYSSAIAKAIQNGSAITPATTLSFAPAISVNASGVVTATVSGSSSITPTVTAGYVSAGTAGTVSVSGSKTHQLTTQAAKTVTPSETSQTAVSAGVYTTGAVTVAAIPSTYVGSDITVDPTPTASGATVTIPEGYYSEQTTKSVSTTTHPNPTASVNSTTGLVTASHTQTAGYVSAGTTTGTLQLTTKAAATINTSTADQSIASGRYLTGAQTIKGVKVTGLTASNIASGVVVKVGDANDDDRITSVTGTLSFVTYYTGSTAPSSSLGNDGDIYLQT